MSKVVVAKKPNLSFLTTGKAKSIMSSCPYPIMLKNTGGFNWDSNNYIAMYAGGPNVYNIKPLATTVKKKAYDLNIFCQFLEDSSIELVDINDTTLYKFTDTLKERCTTDATIISHVRTALGYITYLSQTKPEWYLATNAPFSTEKYRVHYTIKTYRYGNIEIEYPYHRCLDGLIHISIEADIIHDHEYEKWLDAIYKTKLHPDPSNFIISRWIALGTLLEITGSRISEANLITRSMIKEAARDLLNPQKRHILRGIPINKGKYKGKNRDIPVTKEDIQVILIYINLIEKQFPENNHDHLFVDAQTGNKLCHSYLKSYARKVINNSVYANQLRHITNHSFRHRFVTLNIAKSIKKLSKYGSFSSILSVAADACRKITMHASNKTLSHYVHLATQLDGLHNNADSVDLGLSSQVRMKLISLIRISDRVQAGELDDGEALKSLLTEIQTFKKFRLTPI